VNNVEENQTRKTKGVALVAVVEVIFTGQYIMNVIVVDLNMKKERYFNER